jgi:F-type H+-transporting ATPase subunit b
MESLGLDWKLLLAQMVNFGLLFVVLKKVLYKPLMKAIDDRNKKIEDSITNSKKIEERLKKVEEESEKVLEKAREKAKDEKSELIAAANREKEIIIDTAKQSAKREMEKSLESIEFAKKDAVNSISDKYLETISDKLYKRLAEETKSKKNPILRSLLK